MIPSLLIDRLIISNKEAPTKGKTSLSSLVGMEYKLQVDDIDEEIVQISLSTREKYWFNSYFCGFCVLQEVLNFVSLKGRIIALKKLMMSLL